jgi:hypothetical protein
MNYNNLTNQSNSKQIEFEDDIINADYEFTSTDIEENHFDTTIDSDILYPIIPDFDLWESFLNRSLEKKEREVIHDYLLENDTNLQIKGLHYNLISNGPYLIPKLTKNNGNCLFESLSYLGYGTPSEIRKNIAALLLLVKHDYDFFLGSNACPEELFINCNDVEIVKDKNTGQVYEYDYDAMIVDLYTNHSWSRLPMELILMTISRIYEVRIKIFSNKSEYINVISICDSNNLNLDTIHLGHINEEHYVPVIKIDDEIISNSLLMNEFIKSYPKYISAKNEYHKWGEQMAVSIGLYGDINLSSDLYSEHIPKKKDNVQFVPNITNQNTPTNTDLYFDLEQIKDFDDFEIVK